MCRCKPCPVYYIVDYMVLGRLDTFREADLSKALKRAAYLWEKGFRLWKVDAVMVSKFEAEGSKYTQVLHLGDMDLFPSDTDGSSNGTQA